MLDNDIFDFVGNTPIVSLKKYNLKNNTKIFAKLELFNPTGSIKDRICKYIIDKEITNKKINNNTTIIEATSGNTGISLACYGKINSLKIIIVMPENMSIERQKIIKKYGAKLILTPAKDGMKGAINKAICLHNEIDNSIIFNQFETLNNPLTHYEITGPEIYRQTKGNVDYVICGIGTGGTISGIGKYLKEKNKNIKIIGVEPLSSPFITKKYSGKHIIEGIGAGFKPNTLDIDVIDEIITIADNDMLEEFKYLSYEEGLFVGLSSSAVFKAAKIIASKNKEKNILCIFADSGQKYLFKDYGD